MKSIILLFIFANSILNLQSLNTPQKISNFMIANIRYSLDLEELLDCDYLQTIEQTLKLKSGDCDDMAILTNYCLKKIGYDSNIYYIDFSNRKTAHAIVVFKQGDYYSIFSNQYLLNTDKKDLREAIESEFAYLKYINKIIIVKYGKNPKVIYIKIR